MSDKDVLGQILRQLVTLPVEMLGVVLDLLRKLSDPEWWEAVKRFLRKENPWPPVRSSVIQGLDTTNPLNTFPNWEWAEYHLQKKGDYSYWNERCKGMPNQDVLRDLGGIRGRAILQAHVLERCQADPSFLPQEVIGNVISMCGIIVDTGGYRTVYYLDLGHSTKKGKLCWVNSGLYGFGDEQIISDDVLSL